ncbi:hypothetical protein [Streptomyces yanii]|uniref:DUF1877 family protein n=1 Tax=Streptomyces yanii TaxID=78510 RepID=A0ABV5RHF2_9ACTN
MGAQTDYFRAMDAASVVQALEQMDGRSLLCAEPPVFDGVEAKHVDTAVVLAQLIAAIQQVEWELDLVHERDVWPTSPIPDPDEPVAEHDPWVTGPWVSELHHLVRDTLAGVDESEIPTIVARWAQSEDLNWWHVEELQALAEALILLARRAHEASDQLYCWTSH